MTAKKNKKTKKSTSHTTTAPTSNRKERVDLGLDSPVQVNFTSDHREAIRKAAATQGQTLAAFIRSAALKAASEIAT